MMRTQRKRQPATVYCLRGGYTLYVWCFLHNPDLFIDPILHGGLVVYDVHLVEPETDLSLCVFDGVGPVTNVPPNLQQRRGTTNLLAHGETDFCCLFEVRAKEHKIVLVVSATGLINGLLSCFSGICRDLGQTGKDTMTAVEVMNTRADVLPPLQNS